MALKRREETTQIDISKSPTSLHSTLKLVFGAKFRFSFESEFGSGLAWIADLTEVT